jgi:antitoxin YefM
MRTLSISAARSQLFPLISSVKTKGPVCLRGRSGSAVLISEDEWSSIQETLYLMQDPVLVLRIQADQRHPARKRVTWQELKHDLAR